MCNGNPSIFLTKQKRCNSKIVRYPSKIDINQDPNNEELNTLVLEVTHFEVMIFF